MKLCVLVVKIIWMILIKMPNFIYKGRSIAGYPVEGIINADNKNLAATQLMEKGVTPTNISSQPLSGDEKDVFKMFMGKMREKKPGLDDLILFSRQSHTLLKAGLPIIRAFKGLAELSTNPLFTKTLNQLIRALESGLPLSSAMKAHPKVFPPIFTNMIRVGEDSGHLDEAFEQLSSYLQREKDTIGRIKEALRYPAMVLIVMAIAIIIVNLFVIPAFSKVFTSFNVELPLATQLLITTSDFMLNSWHFILTGMILSGIMIHSYINTKQGRYQWDYYRLKLPLIGDIILRATLARLMRALSISLASGVPILHTLHTIGLASGNAYITDKMNDISSGIERGDTLTRSSAASGIFPTLVIQMMAVGEESGNMDELMLEVAEFYDREIDFDIKGLSAAIEPILLIFIGALVLVLALGIFLPMWDLGAAAMGR